MKRFLSMVLTLAMILTLIPAAFAAVEDATEKIYVLSSSSGHKRGVLSTLQSYSGGWKHFGYLEANVQESSTKDEYLGYLSTNTNGLMFYVRSNNMDNLTFALSLEVPSASGFYIPSTYWNVGSTTQHKFDAYMSICDEEECDVATHAQTENLLFSAEKDEYGKFTAIADKAIYTTCEDEIIAAYKLYKSAYSFHNIRLTPILNETMTISVDEETMTASVTVSGKASFYNEKNSSYDSSIDVSMPVSNSFITYSSDNAAVAAIDPKTGVITLGEEYGIANISAETSDGVKCSVEYKVEEPVTEPEEPGEVITDTTVSVAVISEKPEEGSVTGIDTPVGEVAMGTTINPTAVPATGYKFAYWRDSSGTVLSTNPSETFVINTNTAITAVFDEITPEISDKTTVELYNANGMLFHKDENVALNTSFADIADEAGKPSLVGYMFKHWSMYANEAKIEDTMPITALTRAVAIYEEPEAQYTVKVDGTDAVANKKYKYGEKVTVTAKKADFSCWKLGDKIVSYSPSYTFSVWGDVDLTEATDEVTEAPVATLVKDGENHLLIYSVPAGYTKVEAGIIFSKNNSIKVNSFDGQKTSEVRGTGQFMVSSDYTYARGYLIFKNNTSGEIRILYAE